MKTPEIKKITSMPPMYSSFYPDADGISTRARRHAHGLLPPHRDIPGVMVRVCAYARRRGHFARSPSGSYNILKTSSLSCGIPSYSSMIHVFLRHNCLLHINLDDFEVLRTSMHVITNASLNQFYYQFISFQRLFTFPRT